MHCKTLYFFFSRAHLEHSIRLLPHAQITVEFSLRLANHISLNLLPFFHTLNPGFKVYIGGTLFYDYLISSEKTEDSVSSKIQIIKSTLYNKFCFNVRHGIV